MPGAGPGEAGSVVAVDAVVPGGSVGTVVGPARVTSPSVDGELPIRVDESFRLPGASATTRATTAAAAASAMTRRRRDRRGVSRTTEAGGAGVSGSGVPSRARRSRTSASGPGSCWRVVRSS